MNRGKMTLKRIWAFLMACFLGLGLALGNPAPVMAKDASSSVILSVERFALENICRPAPVFRPAGFTPEAGAVRRK